MIGPSKSSFWWKWFEQWYNEIDDDVSDVNSVLENGNIESEHDTVFSTQCRESENGNIENENNTDNGASAEKFFFIKKTALEGVLLKLFMYHQ